MRILHPPQINGYQITHSKTLRFTATAAATNQSIEYRNLLDCIGLSTTAIAGFQLFDLVKIRRISIWGVSALGTPSTVSLTFVGATQGNAGDFQLHEDTSLGFEPAYVSASPSPRAPASLFQVSGNNVAFIFTCPAGAIIDCDLSFRDLPGEATALQNATVGATVGAVFYRGLDSLAIAGTNFPPPSGVAQF